MLLKVHQALLETLLQIFRGVELALLRALSCCCHRPDALDLLQQRAATLGSMALEQKARASQVWQRDPVVRTTASPNLAHHWDLGLFPQLGVSEMGMRAHAIPSSPVAKLHETERKRDDRFPRQPRQAQERDQLPTQLPTCVLLPPTHGVLQ